MSEELLSSTEEECSSISIKLLKVEMVVEPVELAVLHRKTSQSE